MCYEGKNIILFVLEQGAIGYYGRHWVNGGIVLAIALTRTLVHTYSTSAFQLT